MPRKLTSGERHLLRLIAKDGGEDGYAKVSEEVKPLVLALPKELVCFGLRAGVTYVALSETGKIVLAWT